MDVNFHTYFYEHHSDNVIYEFSQRWNPGICSEITEEGWRTHYPNDELGIRTGA